MTRLIPTRRTILLAVTLLVLASPSRVRADDGEFFESKIRPLLVEHCFKCHSSQSDKEPKGGLLLDSREALLKGGDNGSVLVPGAPQKSKLIEALGYANPD